MCCFGWIQWQLFKCFYWAISASKPHCHSRLSKPLLKILSIYRKNILGKQLSRATCFKYVLRMPCAPKTQVFSTKLNMMIKVVKLFTGVLWKSCSDKLYRKHLRGSLFLKKFYAYRLKEDSCTGVFLWVLPNTLGHCFCKKHLWVTASAKYFFLFVMFIFSTKNVSFDLGYFKYFRDKHCELLASSSLWRS